MASIHDHVRSGDLEAVRTYIATGGDLNATDKHQRTPLHLAAWTANKEMLQLLFKAKANVAAKAMDDFYVLHFAVQSSCADRERVVAAIRLVAQRAKAVLHLRTSKGNKTALHLAVAKGLEHVVQVLLECGLDPQAKTSSGQTAVDLAKTNSMKALLTSTSHKHSKAKASAADELDNKSDDGEEEDKEESVRVVSAQEDSTAVEKRPSIDADDDQNAIKEKEESNESEADTHPSKRCRREEEEAKLTE